MCLLSFLLPHVVISLVISDSFVSNYSSVNVSLAQEIRCPLLKKIALKMGQLANFISLM